MNLQLLKRISLSSKYTDRLYEFEYRKLINQLFDRLSSINDDKDQRAEFISSLSYEIMIIDDEDIESILNDYDKLNIS